MTVTPEGKQALEVLGLSKANDTTKIYGLIALAQVARESTAAYAEGKAPKYLGAIFAFYAVLFGENHVEELDVQLCMLGDRWFNDYDELISKRVLGGKSLRGACQQFVASDVGVAIFSKENVEKSAEKCEKYMKALRSN